MEAGPEEGALHLLTWPCSPQEFSQDSQQPLPPWVIYLSCTSELDRFLSALNSGWKTIYQVPNCPRPCGAEPFPRERSSAWHRPRQELAWEQPCTCSSGTDMSI